MLFSDIQRVPVSFNSVTFYSKRRVFRESATTSSMEDFNSPPTFSFPTSAWYTNVIRDAMDHFSLVEYVSLEVSFIPAAFHMSNDTW